MRSLFLMPLVGALVASAALRAHAAPLAPSAPLAARPSAPSEASSSPVAMEALVARALARYPGLASARENATAQEARIGVARAPYFPQITATGGVQRTTSNANTAGVLPTTGQPIDYTTGALGLHQELFNFGKLAAQVDAARQLAEASQQQARQRAADVAYSVRTGYLQWTQARALEANARAQRTRAAALLTQARAFFRAGTTAQLDVTRSQVSYEQARAAEITAHNATQQALRALEAAIGAGEVVTGEPHFPAVPAMAAEPVTRLEARAIPGHPTYQASLARLRAAIAQRDEADRSGLPDLTFDGSYGLRVRETEPAPNWSAGVNVNWPLFTGWSLSSQRTAAAALARAATDDVEDARRQILADVDRAWIGVSNARAGLVPASAAFASARDNLRQAQGRYRAGVGSIIEITDAQAALAQAEGDRVRAETTYHLAITDLVHAVGLTERPL